MREATESHVAQRMPKDEGALRTTGGGSHQMLNGCARDEMDFVTGQPGAMAKVTLFVIAKEVVIEEEAADLLDKVSTKHEASALGAEDRIVALILRTIRFVVTVVIGQTQTSQK